MDVNRLHRALQARRMEMVEARRNLFLQGKLKPSDLDREDWALIVQMDEWANIKNG